MIDNGGTVFFTLGIGGCSRLTDSPPLADTGRGNRRVCVCRKRPINRYRLGSCHDLMEPSLRFDSRAAVAFASHEHGLEHS